MKNVTLSIPDELLRKARSYAKSHGTSLNQMIRDILGRHVGYGDANVGARLVRHSDRVRIKTTSWKWNRDELYDR